MIKIYNLTERFLISFTLTVIIISLNMFLYRAQVNYLIPWIQFFLVTIIILCSWPLLRSGWLSLIERKLNIFAPITLSITFIYVYNAIWLLFPDVFLETFYIYSKTLNLEALAIITTLVLIEQILELKAWRQIGRDQFEVQLSPASIQVKVNLVIRYFIPAIFLLAFFTYFTQMKMERLDIALTLLIITCPFALNLAASMPIRIGIALSTKSGFLFKNAESLEKLASINVMLIHKSDMKSIPSLVIKKFHDDHISIVMLANENDEVTETEVMLSDTDAIESVTFEQNNALIKRLQEQGFTVAIITDDYVADADLTISCNAATEANIILINKNFSNLVYARMLSKKIMNTIRQNLFFIVGYYIFCIPIAMGIFYSAGLIVTPIVGVILMSFSWMFVIANSIRLWKTSIYTRSV